MYHKLMNFKAYTSFIFENCWEVSRRRKTREENFQREKETSRQEKKTSQCFFQQFKKWGIRKKFGLIKLPLKHMNFYLLV